MVNAHKPAPRDGRPQPNSGSRTAMLGLALLGFLIGFWAWGLISPLAPSYTEKFSLSAVEASILVAVPVIVGSLGRIPVGALTDRYGARTLFPIISALTIVPVLLVGFVGTSYPLLLVFGFLLGLGGTVFAIGVPFVNAWYPPERRGTAVGIFGMGMGGTAVAAFTTVPLADAFGSKAPFVVVSIALAAYAVIGAAFLRDAKPPAPQEGTMLGRFWTTFKQPVTLQLSFLYTVAFGGYVAFGVYMPTFLVNSYKIDLSGAAFRTAVFIILAVICRPIGGWLSDKWTPIGTLVVCYAGVTITAFAASFHPHILPTMVPIGSIVFLVMAVCLGAASGAVFALVAALVPKDRVGAVTGVVGAAGGLGGFVPPLEMGALYSSTGDYRIGLIGLALAALAATVFTQVVFGGSKFAARKAEVAG